jgi:formylglycine-generating enzyme required for sulfatase activity
MPTSRSVPFTQLGGRFDVMQKAARLWEPLGDEGGHSRYRRRSDGMRCVLIPAAAVELGSDADTGLEDERPRHVAELDAFLIDAEPVSTTAYCRFLNSAGDVPPGVLADWFVLDADDDRNVHMLVERGEAGWHPLPGAEHWPMILVSWFGANAYSLWANGEDWHAYAGEPGAEPPSFLPSEAQWEYAARGPRARTFPWGDDPPTEERMRFARHRRGDTYRASTLPLADVNAALGMSPFGLHHMAGNVWQWCRDWYDPAFHATPAATTRNPVNLAPSKARSERGGSWIGPAELCRSAYRRGRPPLARGRCLGFRCVGSVP